MPLTKPRSFPGPPAAPARPGALRRLRRLAGMGLLACMAPAHAQSISYRLDPHHTRIQWEVGHFGTSTHRGRFDDIEGQIRLDKASRQGEISISVGTASVTSGIRPLDGMLRGEHFLRASEHPRAWFVARQLRFDGPRLAELRGELTLRDVSQPLTLRATHFNCYTHPELAREVCGGDFEAELRRSDFGITYGLPFVDDRVRLLVQVEAIRE